MATETPPGPNDGSSTDDQPPSEPETDAARPAPPPSSQDAGPRPGVIPEPEERPWDAEPADPFEKIDRSDPFEGRPQGSVPQPDEPPVDDDDPFVDPGPGQPLQRGSKQGTDD